MDSVLWSAGNRLATGPSESGAPRLMSENPSHRPVGHATLVAVIILKPWASRVAVVVRMRRQRRRHAAALIISRVMR
ncbi:hypothetical protein [Plantactinospora sonchi]|uniref:Uncharacterized protein n=1 Tax=Plantactinospora sonchi TaxID=1544735 RepID=A0ABU7RK90_9ACTN